MIHRANPSGQTANRPLFQITPSGALARPGAILVVSLYELGHQPIGLAGPIGTLAGDGFVARGVDLAIEDLDDEAIDMARLIAISVPMHTAMRLGSRLLARIRARGSTAHVTMFGLYATLNAEHLFGSGVDSVMGGEVESPLRQLADRLHRRIPLTSDPVPGLWIAGGSRPAPAAAPAHPIPIRDGLPPLRSYAGFERDGVIIPAGYVEATRGCHHTCTHCPITPVYQGRLVVVPRDRVLADIATQIDAGARHITFGDPDFFNGPAHSLRIARAMRERWPTVSFDATIKIEHLLEHRARLPELADLGCAFVVSAVESINDVALRYMKKGHTAEDVSEAIALLDGVGVPMRPSLLPFSPWETLDSYLALLRFMAERGMQPNIDPVHFAIRLLIPPGSAVLDDPDSAAWLGDLDAAAFSWRWTHPDSRMEALAREVSGIAERGAAQMAPNAQTFAEIWTAAYRATGRTIVPAIPASAVTRLLSPRLTETWFCCAEPTAEQFDALAAGSGGS